MWGASVKREEPRLLSAGIPSSSRSSPTAMKHTLISYRHFLFGFGLVGNCEAIQQLQLPQVMELFLP